jgi:hypothetical protein
MRALSRCLLFSVLYVVISIMSVSAQPSKAVLGGAKPADRQPSPYLDAALAPSSMLLIGGGLLLFGGILRRRLRT